MLKWLIVYLGFGLQFHTAFSQDIKLSRQERHEEKKAKKYSNYESINLWLRRRCFVLNAYYLEDASRKRENVSPSMNYIKVDSTSCVMKTGFKIWSGENLKSSEIIYGTDGYTIEGSLNHYEIVQNPKKLSNTLKFKLKSNRGNYDVFMTVSSDNTASATVTSIQSGQLIFTGTFKTNCIPDTD